jgi:hypothetical protein
MKLFHSGLYVCNLDPVNRYDRGRQYESHVDVAQLADDSGSFQIKTIVASFQRFSAKQSRRDLLSAELNSHAARNSFHPSSGSSLDAIASTNAATSQTDSTSTLLTLSGIDFTTQ